MRLETKTKIEKPVVDESISTAQLSACQKWLKDHGDDRIHNGRVVSGDGHDNG